VTIGPKAGILIGTIDDAVSGNALGQTSGPQLWILPAAEEGRPSNRFAGPRCTALIPPDADLDLEIRAPGYQLWRFTAHSRKALRMKSGERRTLRIRLRPMPG